MKHGPLIASLVALLAPVLLAPVGPAAAQDHQNPSAKTAAEISTVPAGTVMTAPFAEAVARDLYVWGWPIVNAFHRRASFATAPEPGLQDGVLPVAPTGYVGMLHGYISPAQRFIAHPNQDVVYGFGYGAADKDPVVMQVPDFGHRFWVYAIYDARSDEFSRLGEQYRTKPGNYLIVGPNWKGTVPEGIAAVIHAPTELIAMGPRIFMDDTDEDRAAIQQVLNQVVVYPLSTYDGKPKTKVWADVPHFQPAASSSGGGTAGETRWVNPETFFDELPRFSIRLRRFLARKRGTQWPARFWPPLSPTVRSRPQSPAPRSKPRRLSFPHSSISGPTARACREDGTRRQMVQPGASII